MGTLNIEQYKASRPDGGINLVIAGAGTGKTKTLVEKVNTVIRKGKIKPEQILILTFSKKAAEEIKDRVKQSAGEMADLINSSTFHSFCLKFLKESIEPFLEISDYRKFPDIIDSELKNELMYEFIKESYSDFLGIPVDVVQYILDNYENLAIWQKKKLDKLQITEKIKGLRESYSLFKKEKNLIEFEDLIDYSIDILQNFGDIRRVINNRYRYIFIDEFQDTSENNFELIKLLLSRGSPNLFVVGDDWQSIYGFRNARIEYIVGMKGFFPKVNIFKLKVNYRSRKEIVSISNRFIRKNRYRTRKKLKSYKGKGGHVQGLAVREHLSEIKHITEIIDDNIHKSDVIAVLYRNNWQGIQISKKLENYSTYIKSGKIKLMTIHSSKGLEFHTVIISGVADRILPDRTSDIEEERRLFYVALTRAKERLYIIYHINKSGELSRFARELGYNAVSS